jgi:hypothetical protein
MTIMMMMMMMMMMKLTYSYSFFIERNLVMNSVFLNEIGKEFTGFIELA